MNIDYISGKIIDIVGPQHITILTGGLGLGIEIPTTLLFNLNLEEDINLYISTVVREDSIKHYGFKSKDQKEMFLKLTNISGVGPKIGLAFCDIPVETLKNAIEEEDINKIKSINGVGPKLAKKLILELKGSLPKEIGSNMNEEQIYAIEALVNLGIKQQDAEKMVMKEKGTAEEIVKKVLKKGE